MGRKHSPPRPWLSCHPSEHHFLVPDLLTTAEVLGAGHCMERELLNQFIPGVADLVVRDLGLTLRT